MTFGLGAMSFNGGFDNPLSLLSAGGMGSPSGLQPTGFDGFGMPSMQGGNGMQSMFGDMLNMMQQFAAQMPMMNAPGMAGFSRNSTSNFLPTSMNLNNSFTPGQPFGLDNGLGMGGMGMGMGLPGMGMGGGLENAQAFLMQNMVGLMNDIRGLNNGGGSFGKMGHMGNFGMNTMSPAQSMNGFGSVVPRSTAAYVSSLGYDPQSSFTPDKVSEFVKNVREVLPRLTSDSPATQAISARLDVLATMPEYAGITLRLRNEVDTQLARSNASRAAAPQVSTSRPASSSSNSNAAAALLALLNAEPGSAAYQQAVNNLGQFAEG